MDLNCVDPLGRGALLMAIDNENLPVCHTSRSRREVKEKKKTLILYFFFKMVELLVVLGISTRDALLHAIDKEFVEGITELIVKRLTIQCNSTNIQSSFVGWCCSHFSCGASIGT